MALALEMPAFRCRLVLELFHLDCLHQCLMSVMADLHHVCIMFYTDISMFLNYLTICSAILLLFN